MIQRFVMIATLLFVSTAFAQDVCGQNAVPRGRDGNNRPKKVKAQVEQVVDAGFVFIDGKYVATPYRIDYNESRLFLNDIPFDQAVFDSLADKKRRLEGSETRRLARSLRGLLESERSIVLFPGKAVEVVRSVELLNVLVDDETRAEFSMGYGNRFASEAADPRVWETFVRDFECPPELHGRAVKYFDRIKEIGETNAAHASATLARASARQMVEFSAYPLIMVGMLLVAMAFGHLLSFNPNSTSGSAESPEAQGAVRRSLILLAALSGLDLIWTLLASRAGVMKELNPLGAAVINDPLSLMLLKIVATMSAVALLFALRQHNVAQKGAWWGCLICTLLTVRWLTFNSLFT